MPIKSITPLPGYKVRVVFSDGVEGVADMSWVLNSGLHKKLRDPELFKTIQLTDFGSRIVWARDQEMMDAGYEDIYFQITGRLPHEPDLGSEWENIKLVSAEFTEAPNVHLEFSDGTTGELSLTPFEGLKPVPAEYCRPSDILVTDPDMWLLIWDGTSYDLEEMYRELSGEAVDTAEKRLNRK